EADMLGERAEVRVAGRQLRPRVADADHRPAVELVLRKAAVLEPGPVIEAHLVLAREPCLAAQFLSAHRRLRHSSNVSAGRRTGTSARSAPAIVGQHSSRSAMAVSVVTSGFDQKIASDPFDTIIDWRNASSALSPSTIA